MKLYSAIFSIILLAGCTSGEGFVKPSYDFTTLKKVAIVSVTMPEKNPAAEDQVANYFGEHFLKRGYDLIERMAIQKIIEEQKFQQSRLASQEGAAQLGKFLNVQAVVMITVPQMGEDIEMSCKMVDVKDGALLWMGSGTGSKKSGMSALMGGTLGATGGAVAGGSKHRAGGAIAGGAAGAVAGHALEPETADLVKKITAKICESLPSKIR